MTGGRPLRISMIGQRGVPATFGGVERHVEELGSRLADRGHHVTVWCRPAYADGGPGGAGALAPARPAIYRGMHLRYLPAANSKNLEAITHSALSAAAAVGQRPDVVHFHAVGPGLVSPVSRWVGRSQVVLTVHGLDGERAKWSRGAQAVLRLATRMAGTVPHRTIGVSKALAEHFRATYGTRAVYIPNGVEPGREVPPGPALDRFGLTPGRFALFVGRIVPEKAPDTLVRAFLGRQTSPGTADMRLAVVGGSSHTDAYGERVHAASRDDDRVVHTGYLYGDELREMYSHAALFVLPSLVEGLPLTLLEACAQGLPVLASDIAPHQEVVHRQHDGARLFPVGDEVALGAALEEMLAEAGTPEQGAAASEQQDEVLRRYSWEAVTDQTEELYRSLVR